MRVLFVILTLVTSVCAQEATWYSWTSSYQLENSLSRRIQPPPGYVRDTVIFHSFENWLRHLPLKSGTPPVHLFNGALKNNQTAHAAVVDLDVGSTDLQQCADAVMRLRGEYLYSIRDFTAISFGFTSGDQSKFSMWVEGWSPRVNGSNVSWRKSAPVDSSYASFREYMTTVMTYAGTQSLENQLVRVHNTLDLAIGDVFIQGGFPGHSVIVVDMARNENTGESAFLLAQSYMPAQELHILKSPYADSPWYPLPFGQILDTPEWSFSSFDLHRFP